jgi:hypothetical protein
MSPKRRMPDASSVIGPTATFDMRNRFVFLVDWRDAATNEIVAGARVQPSVATDASCLKHPHPLQGH